MNKRHTLEASLAHAEAHLHHVVKVLAGGGGNRSTASDAVDKARASCREARAALKKLERAEA